MLTFLYVGNTLTEQMCSAGYILYSDLILCKYRYRINMYYAYILQVANALTEQMCSAGSILYSHLVLG